MSLPSPIKSKGNENPLISKVACDSNQNKWIIIREIGQATYHASFDDYIKNLELLPKITNAPSLCVLCFCLLTNSQKALHECYLKNLDNVKTPKKFCSAENLIELAKNNDNYKKDLNYELIRMIQNKPLEAKQKTRKTIAAASSTQKKIESEILPPIKESLPTIKEPEVQNQDVDDVDLRQFLIKNKQLIKENRDLFTGKSSQVPSSKILPQKTETKDEEDEKYERLIKAIEGSNAQINKRFDKVEENQDVTFYMYFINYI